MRSETLRPDRTRRASRVHGGGSGEPGGERLVVNHLVGHGLLTVAGPAVTVQATLCLATPLLAGLHLPHLALCACHVNLPVTRVYDTS